MQKLSKKVSEDPIFFLGLGFGTGLLPFAPGTFGTIAAIPLYMLLSSLPLFWYIFITGILFIAGISICQRVAKATGIDDNPAIVWDEIVGYLFTMTAVPLKLHWIITGFILFRFFDIVKPQPIRLIDKQIGGGFGIMLDDLIAALFAWLILQAIIWTLS